MAMGGHAARVHDRIKAFAHDAAGPGHAKESICSHCEADNCKRQLDMHS